MRIFIFILVLVLFSSLALASITAPYINGYTANETCNSLENWAGGVTTAGGLCIIDAAAEKAAYVHEIINATENGGTNGNHSIMFDARIDSCTGTVPRMWNFYEDNLTLIGNSIYESGGTLNLFTDTASCNGDGVIDGVTEDGTWNRWHIVITNTDVIVYINESKVAECDTLPQNGAYFNFGQHPQPRDACSMAFDNLVLFNGSVYSPPPPPVTDSMSFSPVRFYPMNSSGEVFGDETYFNTGNLSIIEKVMINYTINSTLNLSTNTTFWYSANGSNACALGNLNHSPCFIEPSYISFINSTNTGTFDGTQSTQGDGFVCSTQSNNNFTQINVSCEVDEYYNPNIAKHYDALYDFSDQKYQSGTSQRIRGNNYILMSMTGTNIPDDADIYKLDFRVNVSDSLPLQPLLAYICNTSYMTGDPTGSNNCLLIDSKLPSELTDDGTKYRTLLTNSELTQIGNIDKFVLKTDENAAARYYAIQTFAAQSAGYDTQWNYSTTSGTTWINLGDAYEHVANLNWFSASNATNFLIKVEGEYAKGTTGKENSSVNGYSWSIDSDFNLPPVVTITSPAVNSRHGQNLQVNWSITEPNDDNYTINVTLRGAATYRLGENISKDITQQSFDMIALGVADGDYNLTVYGCENETAELLCGESTRTITIDNTLPSLTFTAPANASDTDKTFNNLSIDALCTDVSPLFINATLYNNSGSVSSIQNNSATGTEIKIFQDMDLFNISAGAYWMNVSCADTHTAKTIGNIDYSTSSTNKWIMYDFGKVKLTVDHVSSDSPYIIPEPETIKLSDRYTFSFQPKQDKVLRYTHTFELSSTRTLRFIEDSGYNAHFVSGNAWIDFENDDAQAIYDVTKMDDKRYRVAVTTNDLNFESTGFINIISEVHNLTISETTSISVNTTSPANNTLISADNVTFWYSADSNASCSLFLNNTLNLSQTSNLLINNSFFVDGFNNGTYQYEVNCSASGLVGSSDEKLFSINFTRIFPAEPTETFNVLTCPTTTSGSLNLWLIIILAVVFVFIGLIFNFGIFGFFGSLMLFVGSWYISPCLNIFGLILALVSLFMLIWFALSGLGFVNRSFR